MKDAETTTRKQAPATTPSGISAPSHMVAAQRPSGTPVASQPSSSTSSRVVIAHDGAIVFIGDHGVLKANTGDTSASGAVVIDSSDSRITSGTSTNAAVESDIARNLGGRTVAIAGFENHSVNVAGNDQIVTYDDSNVFINRNGNINANTGDTDSSGLNAVDVTGSVARSGDSADGGADEPGEEPDEPAEPDEGEQAQGVAGLQQNSSHTSAAVSAPATAGGSASTIDSDASTSATGRNPLVIGGDGYDDLAIRSSGNRNVITYDDSNVVIGGTGDVNAQIGDSDTGGAVVMDIDQSHVEAGGSL